MNNQLDGVTYDPSVYKVIVTVTDDNNGNLKAEITSVEKSLDGKNFEEYSEEAPVFENKYETSSAVIELYDITKVLEGVRKEGDTVKPLQAGEFTFELSIVRPNTDDNLTREDGITVEKQL